MRSLIIFLLVVTVATPAAALSMKEWRAGRDAIIDEIRIAEEEGAEPVVLADLWVNHGDYNYNMAGYQSFARKSYEKAVVILEDAGIPSQLLYAVSLINVGKTHMVHSKKRAQEYFDQATLILNDEVPPDHPVFQTMAEFYSYIDGKQKPSKPMENVAVGPRFNDEGEPIPIYKPDPRFPPEALLTDVEATIVVNFTIEADGSVSDAKVVETKLGRHGSYSVTVRKADVRREYRREALRAIKQYKFRPAIEDGEYIRQEDQHLRLHFKIASR